MTDPRGALRNAGAETTLISPEPGQVRGWNHTEWGREFNVDLPLSSARCDDYDALLLPAAS